MGVRPVDLQPLVLKAPDIVRDVAGQQQQAATAEQEIESETTRRQDQRAEIVQAADEIGAAAIHEREPRSDEQQDADQEEEQAGAEPREPEQPTNSATAPRMGRHIDIQA